VYMQDLSLERRFLLQLDEPLTCIRWITLGIGFLPKGASAPAHRAFTRPKLSAPLAIAFA
jgi:hypothetical protein